MSSKWTHLLCRACYAAVEPGREPMSVRGDDANPCCRCGDETTEGIYYRADPKLFRCEALSVDSIHRKDPEL